jgi:prevent-host-death family protein
MKQKRKQKQNKTEEIGIRELKSHASEVVRAVKEQRARYVITQRGKPAALLIPLDSALPGKSADEVWDRLMKIGEEISKGWQSEKSAVEILSEMRR